MRADNIYYHPNFSKSFKTLPQIIKEKAIKQEAIFRQKVFDKRLNTHKLHGRLKDLWSFSIDNKYRIVFLVEKGKIVFLEVGDHDVYK
ncbi:MAG: hypothetical protein A2939_01715 [Parcubacteria group bacterium RIFCSPLOWO2_01_FULL_48_18]|nr:MAG: hypothetical protein A3J67_04930 [Parcubacteria group bacterium RIFCSPHIGHO2_02_FULL_48_10b]OHB21796.1 MAG: hypothetical protein A2939_01715 [Parcubacteria group bacterium RIFCSPLOWO2_01_FULL_48_18]